jgi:hypothetical protein
MKNSTVGAECIQLVIVFITLWFVHIDRVIVYRMFIWRQPEPKIWIFNFLDSIDFYSIDSVRPSGNQLAISQHDPIEGRFNWVVKLIKSL